MRPAVLACSIVTGLLFTGSCARTPDTKAAQFLSRGQSRLAKHDYDRAALEFRNAARVLPNNAEPEFQLAMAYLDSGDYHNGIVSLLRAVELDPRHAGAQLKLEELRSGEQSGDMGSDLLNIAERRLNGILEASSESRASGASAGASVPDLERAYARNSQSADIQASLVQAYIQNRRFIDAEKTLDRVLEGNESRRKRASRVACFKQLWGRIIKTDNPPEDAEQTANSNTAEDAAEQAKQTADELRRRENREDARMLVLRGQLYLATVRAKEAEQDLVQALALDSHDPLGHYLLSKVHQVHGSEFARRQELAETVQLNPEWLEPRLELALSRTDAGAPDGAVDLLDQAPQHQQSDVRLLAARNWALLALDDRVEARKSLDRSMTLANSPEFLLQEAYLRLRTGETAAARKVLEVALRGDAPDLRAVDALAESYWREHNRVFALAAMRGYASRYPTSAGLQYLLGTWLLRANEPAQAKAAFETAVTNRPGFVKALERLADIEIASGNLEAAHKTIALIAASPGGNSAAELALGVLEERSGGNPESAIVHYRKVLEDSPDNVTALNNLAYHLAGEPQHAEEALKLALRLKKLAPNRASVDDTLGWAYYKSGGYELAVSYLQAAVAKQAKPGRKYRLAMAFFKSGAKDRAQSALRDAEKMDPRAPEAAAAIQLISSANVVKQHLN
jgi:tetratricopeptide (TPR) repeat protein